MASVALETSSPEDLVLKFEIVPGRSPDAVSVALALAAFVEALKASAAIVDPESDLLVELVGVEPGSQQFRLALTNALARIRAGAGQYPLIKKSAITLGPLVGTTVLSVLIANAITPDPRIPADQMAVFDKMEKDMSESVELQRQSARFWGIMQDDPAFDRVDVLRGRDRTPVYQVPRSEFAARSGVWSGDSDDAAETTERRTATWDVILVKPVLVPEQRRWTFARDGIEFSALMTDQSVLQAIHDRTLPLQIAEGVTMKIEVQYRERWDGKVWIPVPGSHRVKRVISPQAAPALTGLFASADRP